MTRRHRTAAPAPAELRALFLAAYQLRTKKENASTMTPTRYRCPSCGTTEPLAHKPNCTLTR